MKYCSLILLFFLTSCGKSYVDSIWTGGKIYSVDSSFNIYTGMAVKNGKILALGSTESISSMYKSKNSYSLNGKYVYPGFIDAHCHFIGYGLSQKQINLKGTNSWQECLKELQKFAKEKNIQPGEWITGRGWDQTVWNIKEWPDNEELSRIFPDIPVFIRRVDGHAGIANKLAIKLANISSLTRIEGGQIMIKNGQLTGLMTDNAMDLIIAGIPAANESQITEALQVAASNCYAVGLTGVVDCGISYDQAEIIQKVQESGNLKMKIYAMLSDEPANFTAILQKGKINTPSLKVRSFKVYGDGALGSRGACLLKDYTDMQGHRGFMLSSKEHFDSVASFLYNNDLQMCTHAIGDSSNRTILGIYARYLRGPNDRRWRIEHAQVIDPQDFGAFRRFNIIPSVQPTHATSDMYWAEQRLGPERIHSAYAYRSLLYQNNWLPLGTDFPVEDISPFKTFASAVFRQDEKDWPPEGFEPENAINRTQALRGMTFWAAKSTFEENDKGSLEPGKAADFIIVDTDIMQATHQQILKATVWETVINGEIVYSIRR